MIRRWLPLLFILLIAAVLRLVALPTLPPGLQHDEVFHGHDAVTVLLGYRPLYFTSNAGNEPLFIYLMALTVGLFGHTVWGIRLAAVMCGLLTVLFTYLWIRRAYNDRAALTASALLAVGFWPIFLSRVGLRAASVPMLAALTAWLLFEALHRHRLHWFVLTGIALGVSLYTYPAARTLPVIYVLFFVLYSLLTYRLSKSGFGSSAHYYLRDSGGVGAATAWTMSRLSLNRSLLVTLLAALIVVAPLAYTIATLPEADVRLQQLGGPVQEALRGNFEPVLRYMLATLGLFNLMGDPIARYNLPGRPVFDVITGILFLLGLLLALRKWREPRNLFVLLWLPIGLLPSMLSDSAPSFLRASASLPVAFLFPALAVDWLLTFAVRPSTALRSAQDARRRRLAGYALVIGLIIFSAVLTIRDYFWLWPNRLDVREVYRSDLAAAAQWLTQQPSNQPVVIASTNPRDLDPFLFDFQAAPGRDVRWIDRAFALAFPVRSGRLISPAFSPIDPALRDRFLSTPAQIEKFADGSTAFEVYDLALPPLSAEHRTATTDGAGELSVPIDVSHTLEFLGHDAPSHARPGEVAPLTLYWRVKHDVDALQLPLSLFVHVLNEQGEFAAGRDLLAYPTAGWRSGDVWLQQNDVPLPLNLKPGKYRLEIGVYSQADGARWRVYDARGQDTGDRLLLSEIEVQP